jgi:aspartate racemase
MKVIGCISEMSWNSWSEYCQLINEFIAEKLDGFHSAHIITYSLGFDDTEPNDMLRVLPGREQK